MIRLPKNAAMSGWLRDPGTRALAKSLREDQVPQQLKILLTNCASSTDPNVLREYHRYALLADFHNQLGGKEDEEGDEE